MYIYSPLKFEISVQSGLQTRWWIEKLVNVCGSEGRTDGPAFADADGWLASSPD